MTPTQPTKQVKCPHCVNGVTATTTEPDWEYDPELDREFASGWSEVPIYCDTCGGDGYLEAYGNED